LEDGTDDPDEAGELDDLFAADLVSEPRDDEGANERA
jgi:hypothetical protein